MPKPKTSSTPASAPVPAPVEPVEEVEGGPAPTPLSSLPKLARLSLDSLVSQYLALGAEIKSLEDDKSKLMKDHIQPLLKRLDIPAVESTEWTLKPQSTTRTTIEKHLLLQAGVTTDIISRATVRKVSTFYRIHPKKSTNKQPHNQTAD